MAARLNTRFLLILLIALGVIGIFGGGTVLLIMRFDAERNIRAGDAAMAQENYEDAMRQYGRAVSKEGSNVEYLKKFENALTKVRPVTESRSFELYEMYLAVLSQAAQIQHSDEAAQVRLLNELYRAAQMTNAPFAWQRLRESAQTSLSRNPDNTAVAFFQAVAKDRLRASLTLTPSEIEEIDRQLRAYVDEYPESERGWEALIFSRFTRAEREPRAEAREAMLEDTDEILSEASKEFPDSLEIQTLRARRIWSRHRIGDETVTAEDVQSAFTRIESLAAETEDVVALAGAANTIGQLAGEGSDERALALYQRYLQSYPNSVYVQYLMARQLREVGRLDDAEEHALALMEARPLPVSFMGQFQYSLRKDAAKQLFDIELARYDRLSGEERDAYFPNVVKARDELASRFSAPEEETRVAEADAWVAFFREDYIEATREFEQVLSDPQREPVARNYLGAAMSLERIGELGRARDRLQEGVETFPRAVRLLTELARLHFVMGTYEETEVLAQRALDISPDNPSAQQWLLEAQRQMGRDIASDEGVDDAPSLVRTGAMINEAMASEDYETARDLIMQAKEQHPGVPQLDAALIQAETQLGNTVRAVELIDDFLAKHPDMEERADMIRVRGQLRGDDPLEILTEVVEDEAGLSAGQRAARKYAGAVQLIEVYERRRAQVVRSGDQTEAGEIDSHLQRFRATRERWLKEAIAQAPEEPILIEFRFREAIEAEDWNTAEDLAVLSREHNIDRVQGTTYFGRLALARGNAEEAARLFLEAAQTLSYASDPHRMLARAYEEVGNIQAARDAYRKAFEIRPNERATVGRYVNLLVNSGSESAALEVLRQTEHYFANDLELRELRINLEFAVGDQIDAIRERQRIYQENPRDVVNALRLAGRLGSLDPGRENIVDPSTGEQKFTQPMWNRMPRASRNSEIQQQRARWAARANEIFDQLVEDGVDSLEFAQTRAVFLRDQGQVQQGARVLQDYVSRRTEPSVREFIALAQYHMGSGNMAEAIPALEKAVEFQDPEIRQADQILANLLFSYEQYERAAQSYRELVKSHDNRAFDLRLIDCEIQLGNLDQAEQLLQQTIDKDEEQGSGERYETILLGAAVARARGDLAAEQGNAEEAANHYQEEQRRVERAVKVAPDEPLVFVNQALTLKRRYERTGRPSLLDDALFNLGQALRLRAGYPPALRARADILMAMDPPDYRGAVTALQTILDNAPRDTETRNRLIAMHAAYDQLDEAVQLASDAVALHPASPAWPETLGDLHVRLEQFGIAATAFRLALDRQENPNRLFKYARAVIQSDDPDYQRVVNLLQPRQQLMSSAPILRCYYAVATARDSGDFEAALAEMEQAYRKYRELITTGSAEPSAISEWFEVLAQLFANRPPGEATAFVMRLTQENPDPYELASLAELWLTRGVEGRTAAEEYLRRALEQSTAEQAALQSQILFQLAVIRSARGEHQEAAVAYERLIEMDPDNAAALNNLAWLYVNDLGDPERALPYIERAAELMEGSHTILDTLGYVQFRLGHLDEAERTLQRSVNLNRGAENTMHYAQVLMAQGHKARAGRELREALQLRPDARIRSEIERLLDDIQNNPNRP